MSKRRRSSSNHFSYLRGNRAVGRPMRLSGLIVVLAVLIVFIVLTVIAQVYVVSAIFAAIAVILVVVFRRNRRNHSTVNDSVRNQKNVSALKQSGVRIALYEWVKSTSDKSKSNHRAMSPDEESVFDDDGSQAESVKRASIELYENGKAIYLYVYSTVGDYYEWECDYQIIDGEILLIPYFYTSGTSEEGKCEVFKINDKGVKYIGNRILYSDDKPVRDLPYSMYTNFVRRQ